MAEYFFSTYEPLIGRASSGSLTPRHNTALLESSLSSGIQAITRPGGRWALTLTWENIYGDKRRELMALLTLLNGAEHTLNIAPQVFGHTQRGDWTGSPVVDGGSQTGNTLAIRGATISITDWAKAGDLFRIGSQFVMATEDADTDGTGDATISIWPELRGSPADGTALVVNQAEFKMIGFVDFSASARGRTNAGDDIGTVSVDFIDTGAF